MTKNINLDDAITAAEEHLRELKERARQAMQAKLDSVKPVYRVTVAPDDRRFDKVHDPAVVQYRIEGTVVNAAEMKAAGHHNLFQGGMTWLFNTATGKLIGSFSGGSVFIGGMSFSCTDEDKARAAAEVDAVAAFIVENPNGGDITHLTKYAS